MTAAVRDQDDPDAAGSPRLLVTVGTDHHPFDRLVVWMNEWFATRPELVGDTFFQYGPATVEPLSDSSRLLGSDEVSEMAARAQVIVCHGGPGCMADAWRAGLRPIVVPRLRRHLEVVDDHQVDFCRKLDSIGRVHVAESAAELSALLDEALAGSPRFRLVPERTEAGTSTTDHGGRAVGGTGGGAGVEAGEEAVELFGRLVDELMAAPARRRIGRLPSVVRRPWRGDPHPGPAVPPGKVARPSFPSKHEK